MCLIFHGCKSDFLEQFTQIIRAISGSPSLNYVQATGGMFWKKLYFTEVVMCVCVSASAWQETSRGESQDERKEQ